ncbi:MAG: hypothetical protein IT266_04615 [Saprospiraceae bacterium]|nr:hypothetical protein [Saprospiraceae bacterium]
MSRKVHPIVLPVFLAFCAVGELHADFSLVCPPDVTISCREDYLHDPNVYGKAHTLHNGKVQYIHDCKTVIEIDDCGAGTIKRVWGVENPENWEWLLCTQIITVSNVGAFSYRDIAWPPAIVLESCDPEADLRSLTEPYDAPQWLRTICAKPMVSYKDTRYAVNPGCIKLLREWKILDWCQYDPVEFPGRGLFTYTQVIKLIQNSDTAKLQCARDTSIVNDRNCDSLFVQLEPSILKTGCGIYHDIHNTSSHALDSSADATGYYPNGLHLIPFYAEYACGTISRCTTRLEIKNGIRPTPYCLDGVVAVLMPLDTNGDGRNDGGMAEIWASDLDHGSWHKCGGQQLRYSFSSDSSDRSRMFACPDVGEQEVEIWVFDENGNSDVCKTQIEIQNNDPTIPDCDPGFSGNWRQLKGENLTEYSDLGGHDKQWIAAREMRRKAGNGQVEINAGVVAKAKAEFEVGEPHILCQAGICSMRIPVRAVDGKPVIAQAWSSDGKLLATSIPVRAGTEFELELNLPENHVLIFLVVGDGKQRSVRKMAIAD